MIIFIIVLVRTKLWVLGQGGKGIYHANLIIALRLTNIDRLPGLLKHISVSKHSIWGVNADDDIYHATNIRFDSDGNIELDWEKDDGRLMQISINAQCGFD